MAEVAANYARAAAANPDGIRLLIWEAMGDTGPGDGGSGDAGSDPAGSDPADAEETSTLRTEWMGQFVEDIRARQRTGEMPPGVDPRVLGLMMFAAAAAPVAFAPVAAAMGIEKSQTADWYADQLTLLVRALSP
ncbi:hypothetical protein [Fodinicola feengrottensis]|uniref:hypothetical protein n=1 Tax=Fodinicola feengrottensis TaxID=435914 RepID=UPI002442AFE7|nr:hypothetical protein [Fodinicola feengrottensis]